MIINFKTAVLFAILVLSLGTPAFFHAGSTFEFRIVISSFELMFIIIFSFFYLKKDSQYDLPRHEFIVFVLWAVCALISVILSDHYAPATMRQWEWFCQILFSFCLWVFLRNNKRFIVYTHLIVIAGFLLVCTGLVFYWNMLHDSYHYDWVGMTPDFINIRHFSHYCTALVILSTGFLLSDSKKYYYHAGSFLVLSVCWGFLFWSGGRGGIGSAFAGVFFVYLLSGNKKKSVMVIISLSCLAGYLLSNAMAVESTSMGLFNAVKRHGISGRIDLWVFSLKWIKTCPFFGLGPDGFRFFPDADFIFDHPHNTIIQLALAWGVPGILLFIYLQYRLMILGLKNLLKEKIGWLKGLKAAGFSWIAASVIFGLVDGIYYFAIPMTLTAYSFAILLLPVNDKISQNSPEKKITINRCVIRSAASVLAMILVLHIYSSQSLRIESIPGPFSIRGRIVRFFPTNPDGFEKWIEKWAQDDPDTALATAIKFAENSPGSNFFWEIAAKIKMDQGDQKGAKLIKGRVNYRSSENEQYR